MALSSATRTRSCAAAGSAKAVPFTTARVAVPKTLCTTSAPRFTPAVVCQAAAVAEAPAAETSKKFHPSPLTQAAPATYAIVEIGGHQMFVEPGKWYTCNRLKADVGSKIKFGRVLALKHEGKLHVGQPYLSNVNIEAEILEELRGPKLIVYKMQPKKHYRRKNGHRQELSKFMIHKIELA